MHEMGIALEIIDIAVASIPPDVGEAAVERVNLRVGKLSAIVPESLRFCFGIASKETPLAGAELHIEEIPVVARCNGCENEWVITTPAFSCPKCNCGDIRLLSGKELDIVSIELSQEDD